MLKNYTDIYMKYVCVSPLMLVPFTLLFLTGCSGDSSSGSDDAELLDDPITTPVDNSTATNDPGSDNGVDTDDSDGTGDDDGTSAPPTLTTGNQNTSTQISGQFSQVGAISVEYSPSLDETSLSGFFLSFDQFPVDASEIEEGLIGVIDTCVVTNIADIDVDFDFDFDIPEIDFSTISAGEAIPFVSQQGSFAELQRSAIFGFTLYNTPNEGDPIAGAPPATLEFSIPGDEFPAFNAIPAQVPELLQINSPAATTGFGSAVNADTVFTWTASNTPDSRVSISSGDSRFETSVDCIVADDGEFEFPDDIKSELGSFSGFFTTIKRELVSTYLNGNTLLVVTRSNGE